MKDLKSNSGDVSVFVPSEKAEHNFICIVGDLRIDADNGSFHDGLTEFHLKGIAVVHIRLDEVAALLKRDY